MDRRHFLTMSLSLAATAALAACGDDSATSSAAPGTADSGAATSTAAAGAPTSAVTPADPTSSVAGVPVPESLQFTASLVGGGTFDGAAYAGTPLALWFWAPT